jgi:hypothetical protein
MPCAHLNGVLPNENGPNELEHATGILQPLKLLQVLYQSVIGVYSWSRTAQMARLWSCADPHMCKLPC